MIAVVGLGPGDPDAVPAAALQAVRRGGPVLAPELPEGLAAVLGVAVAPLPPLGEVPDGAVIAAPDAAAYRIARDLPDAVTVPGRDALRARAIGAEVARLAAVGARLRRDCPWDREQTAETIVPHTIEEAFEVAEAVASGDPAKQADELGDLLFQSVFLAQLLEEPGLADLAGIAGGQADKLVSRHPHVYGDEAGRAALRSHDPEGVVDMWERRKREERADQGIFHDLPRGLPALAYATKAQKRAAAVGFDFRSAGEAIGKVEQELAELRAAPDAHELGDVLFACVAVGRALGVDVELAVRAAAVRFRARVERAAELAARAGVRFEDAGDEARLAWYERAKSEVAGD
ncbi:MAG: nucleoside triphosphate pyrophosphohydrolase [Actinomycetota bacterium]